MAFRLGKENGQGFDTPAFRLSSRSEEAEGAFGSEDLFNYVRNPNGAGAVAGTPGTFPTNWQRITNANLALNVIAANANSCDVQLVGTTNSTVGSQIGFESNSWIAAMPNQEWTQGLEAAIIAGAITNISNIQLLLSSRVEDGSSQLEALLGGDIKSSLTSSLQLFTNTKVPTNVATARVAPRIIINYASGVAIDITLRLRAASMKKT